jgi:hypothetical protein
VFENKILRLFEPKREDRENDIRWSLMIHTLHLILIGSLNEGD